MNLNKLNKAAKIFEEIRILDKEIIEIDSFAMKVANGLIKTTMSMTFEEAKEDDTKVSFDFDGSLIMPKPSSYIDEMIKKYSSGLWYSPISSEKESKASIVREVSETATLQIFGVLIGEKQEKRTNLINQLKELGVNI